MRNKFYRKTQRLKKVRPLSNVKKRELLSKVIQPKKEESTNLEKAIEPVPSEVAALNITPETTPTTESTENTNEETPQEESVQEVVKPKRVRKTKVVTETTEDNTENIEG